MREISARTGPAAQRIRRRAAERTAADAHESGARRSHARAFQCPTLSSACSPWTPRRRRANREKSSYSIGTAELRQDQMGKPVGEEIHAIGPAYHPEDELYKGTEGEKGRVVPKNVYTGAMIQYLVVSKSRLCHVLLKFALPISLTLVVQVTLAYYLWRGVGEADGDLAADCASTDLYLQLAASRRSCALRCATPWICSTSTSGSPCSRRMASGQASS